MIQQTKKPRWWSWLFLLLVSILSATNTSIEFAPLFSNPAQADVMSPEEYEDSLTGAAWVRSGYLYIHYLRENPTEYPEWSVWAWQKVPVDNDGTTFNWVREDQSGKIAEIDLNAPRFSGATKVGFLIVLTASMSRKTGMWTSDSNGDVYITNVPSHVRNDGSIHIFATQGNSINYTFFYEGAEAEDPYANDMGQFTSKSNVNSNATSAYLPPKTSPDFYQNAGIGYQIQVASYADSNGDGFGDIQGIINKLSYIKGLNVDVIWLTPVQECESYHGYDTLDYYAIDERFGTLRDYRRLMYEAHKLDIRVVMDLVVNHTSLNNVWFRKSVQLLTGKDINKKDIDYRNFYHWRYSLTELAEPWYRFGTTNYYYYAKFASNMPELNYDYQGTRDAMVDVAKYWLGFGLDGFRIDAVKHVYMKDEVAVNSSDVVTDISDKGDYSSDRGKNLNFFKEFSSRIKALYPDTFIVGENFDGWDERIAPYYSGMDSLFDFAGYYHMVYNTFYDSGENDANTQANSKVPAKLNRYHNARQNGKAINSIFTSNHDVERMINHVNNNLSGSQSAVSESHRAVTSANAATAIAKAQVYAAGQILQPGLTWIYYGDELGMAGNIIPNDGVNSPTSAIGEEWNEDRWYRQPMKWKATSDDSTTGYGFNGYSVEWDTYNRDTLKSVEEQDADPNSMLRFFKTLTELKSNSVYKNTFIYGTYTGVSSSAKVFSFQVSGSGHTIKVYVNFGTSQVSINAGGTLLFGHNGSTTSNLTSYGVAVVKM